MSNNPSQFNQSLPPNRHISNLIDQNKFQDLERFLNKITLPKSELMSSFFKVLSKFEQCTNFLKLIELFLKQGVNANTPIILSNANFKIEEKDKITLLMLAVMIHDIELAKLLLSYGALPDQEDANQRTALVYSILYDHNDNPLLLSLLLNHDGNINYVVQFNSGDNGYEEHSLFTLSCSRGLINITRELLEFGGVNVNFRSKPSDSTGLHFAVKEQNINLINLILNFADYSNLSFSTTNAEHRTAQELAKDIGGETYQSFLTFFAGKNFDINNSKPNQKQIYGDMMNAGMNQGMNSGGYVNQNANNNQRNMNNNQNNMKYYQNYQNYNQPPNEQEYINNNNYQNYNMDYAQNMNNNINNNQNVVNNQNMNSNMNYNSQMNNDDDMYNEINNEKIITIKNKLNSKIYKTINIESNHLEIPVIFHKQNYPNNTPKSKVKLNNFFKKVNGAVLCLDLSDKTYELELLKNKLSSEITDKLEKMKKFEKDIKNKERELDESIKILSDYDNKIKYYQSLQLNNSNEIKELTKKKNDLYEKLPQKNLFAKALKNLPQKEFCEVKFTQNKLEENYISSALQKDLLDYKEFIHIEMVKKKEYVDKLFVTFKDLVSQITANYEVKIFGSYAQNLAVPWSDVNFILVNINNLNNTNDEYYMLISQLEMFLSKKPWVTNLHKIEPTLPNLFSDIRLITGPAFGELSVSIAIQTPNTKTGLRCVELVNNYMSDYPILEPLILALKTILKNANLNNPLTGGLSSYGLILLVVSYLQSKDRDNADNINESVLGKVFIGFLGHYGLFFDYQKYVVVTNLSKRENNREILEQDNKINITPTQQHEFMIADPLNPSNNVAKVSHQFMNLKMAFMIAYMVAKEDCECGCHYGKASYLYQNHDIEHCILKRMFNSVKRFTDNK